VTYILIAVIIMVALSPLISMMPSRHQRQVAGLRQKAALCGLLVQLRTQPNAESNAGLLPFYSRRRPRGDRKLPTIVIYRRDGETWSCAAGTAAGGRWTPAPEEMVQLLSQLPTGVSYVCENLHDVGLFWDEQGTETDIERMDEVLRKLLA
jgi:hypothetical protein